MGTINIEYLFQLEDQKKYKYTISLDDQTLLCIPRSPQAPDWCKLEFNQCSNCPLSKETTPLCPIAHNLSLMIDNFSEIPSFTKATVYVRTIERVYCKHTDVQTGLLAAFGAIMATSGCPHFELFRPLARYHLPFASFDETMFRVVSMNFLEHYFNAQENKTTPPSFPETLTILKEKYKNIEKVNKGMLSRIQKVAHKDADKNAFVGLNNFAQMFSFEVKSNFIDGLATLFRNKAKKKAA